MIGILEDYSYYLRMERQMSPNTVAAYVRDVRGLQEFLSSNSQSLSSAAESSSLEKAATTEIESYLASRSADISKRTQARLLSALRTFYDWLVLEGSRPDNPCLLIDMPKLGRYLPDVLSREEVASILDAPDAKTLNGRRDRAILMFLYGCGLRVSEACGLKLSCIYEEEGIVRVIGKGDKERLVPVAPACVSALKEYLADRPAPASDQARDLAFLNKFGEALSRVSVFKMVKAYAMAAGVNKEISPHTFRHSFATHMIENGADLRVVQEMLGHESILTTEIYTHIDTATWQSAIMEHHPLAR